MKLKGKFSSATIEPILHESAFRLPADVEILNLSIDTKGGEVLLEVPHLRRVEVTEILKKRGISVLEIGEVSIDETRCTDCGVCISVCKYDAINFDKSLDVHLDTEKCVRCGYCFDVCPVLAIKTNR